MYKFRVYIYLIRVPFCACQKSYGFKNLVKLGVGQTNFKIRLDTRVFKKSCSTSILAGVGSLFDNFDGFFCSKSRACQLASLTSQTKPSRHKPSRTKWNLATQASHIIAKQRKPSKLVEQTKQVNQSKYASKQAANKQAKQLTLSKSSKLDD